MMRFIVLDRISVTKYEPSNNAVLIRILEPEGDDLCFNMNKYKDVLMLRFSDIVRKEWLLNEEFMSKEHIIPFDEVMAESVYNFINRNDFDEIVIHCHAGVSRSSTLCGMIMNILNLKEHSQLLFESDFVIENENIVDVFNSCRYSSIERTVSRVECNKFELDEDKGIF